MTASFAADTEDAAQSDTRSARAAAFAHLRQLLTIVPMPRWATPTLIVLGLLASFAETVGISLVVLFVYSAMGHLDDAISMTGTLGSVFRLSNVWLDSSLEVAVIVFVLIVARGALAYANSMISAVVGERLSARIREQLHEQYLRVEYAWIQRRDQAELLEVIGTESWAIAGAYAALTRVVIGLSAILVFSVALLAVSWRVAAIAGIAGLLLSIGMRRLSSPAQQLGERLKQVHQSLYEQMLVTLQGLRTIRAYGMESHYHRRFLASSTDAESALLQQTRLAALLNPLTEIGYLAILCVILIAANRWQVPFPTTMAAVALIFRLQPYARELEWNLLYIAQIEPQLRSVRAVLRADDKHYPDPGHRAMPSPWRRIRFDRVSFRYATDASPALDDVSFDIPAGDTTALIGASGAGKTTVINLLLRLYEPTSGTIWVDDTPLREIRREEWLRSIAVSGQDVELIEGSVRDNVRMSRLDASEADVADAADLAGVAEFVRVRPEGYDAWIGQQGLSFSGGQRQRIELARAILRNPAFLVLDEAMSALDVGLEEQIRGAIDRRFAGRTVLLITHRPDSARQADHLVVLDRGKVVSAGPAPEVPLTRRTDDAARRRAE